MLIVLQVRTISIWHLLAAYKVCVLHSETVFFGTISIVVVIKTYILILQNKSEHEIYRRLKKGERKRKKKKNKKNK